MINGESNKIGSGATLLDINSICDRVLQAVSAPTDSAQFSAHIAFHMFLESAHNPAMNGRLGQVVESPGQLWGEIVDSNYRRRFDHQIPEFHSASSTFGRSGQQSPGDEIEPPILGAVRFCQTQTEQVKPEPLDLDPPGTVGLTI